jgi:hypothetical protein
MPRHKNLPDTLDDMGLSSRRKVGFIDFLQTLLDDENYRARFKEKMLAGKLHPTLERMVHHYVLGPEPTGDAEVNLNLEGRISVQELFKKIPKEMQIAVYKAMMAASQDPKQLEAIEAELVEDVGPGLPSTVKVNIAELTDAELASEAFDGPSDPS